MKLFAPPATGGCADGDRAGSCTPMGKLGQIQELLRLHPSARLMAGATDSRPMPMPVPESVPVPRERCLPPSILDALDPADYEKLIAELAVARSTGHGRTDVHFSIPDAEPLWIDIFDTLEEFDVVLCVLSQQTEESTFLERLTNYEVAPRRSRLTQDALGRILACDEGLERTLGYPAGALVGHRSSDFVHPDDLALVTDSWRHVMADADHPRLERVRYRAMNASYVWFEVLLNNRLDSDGVIVWTFADVSDEMAAQHQMADREALLHQITESLPHGVMQVDATGVIRHSNRRLTAVLGFALSGHISELGDHVVAGDKAVLTAAVGRALTGHDVDVRVVVTPSHDRPRVCEITMRGLAGESVGGGVLVCVTEVTESVRLQQLLEYQATHDSLTDCLNRQAILAFLAAEIAREDATGRAALFIDLDLFKMANDRYGHAAGDEILSVVGSRLANLLRPGDAVGRLGGDEFLAVFRGVSTLGEAQKLGYRVAAALSQDIHIGTVLVASSASVGVSWSQGTAATADEIVARADAAMYAAKGVGGHASVIHRRAEVLASQPFVS